MDTLFYSQGKLLLSGEYFVLDGATALAVPTRLGQRLKVTYSQSAKKILHWKSYDSNGQLWFEAVFDGENFDCLEKYAEQKSLVLEKVLKVAKKLAVNFLKDKESVLVETYLEFPRLWGLGSSSTLIHSVAKWAGVNPFELLAKTFGGSGYDVACADSDGPIFYEKHPEGQQTTEALFDPPFKKQLYFVYLGQKQSSADGISYYKAIQKITRKKEKLVQKITKISKKFVKVRILNDFEDLLNKHEQLIAESLQLTKVKDLYFQDYWGQVKSLGAWGGDFVLVTSARSEAETRQYFLEKGFEVFVPYQEMVKTRSED